MFLKKHLFFLIIIVLTVVFSFPYHEGIGSFDAGDYCKCAFKLMNGEFELSNVYCNRVGSYLPVTIILKIFGFSHYLTWVSVAELVMLICVLYVTLREYNKEVALISCAIIGFSPLLLEWSGRLYGDIIATLTCNLCILWVFHTKFVAGNPNLILRGIALSFLWYFALITKETAFFYLAPLFVFFVYDRKNGQYSRFWYSALATSIVLGFLFLGFYAIQTGDPLFRLHLVENAPSASTENYAGATWQMILSRITILPFKFLLETYSFFIVFVFSLIQLFSSDKNEKERFIGTFLISLGVVWWAGTQSFKSWNPVSLTDRLWMPLMVPMAMNAAYVIHSINAGGMNKYATWQTRIILLIVSVAVPLVGYLNETSIFSAGKNNSLSYLLPRLTLLALTYLAIFHQDIVKRIIEILYRHYLVAFAVGLLLLYNASQVLFKNPNDNNYFSDLEMINLVRQSNEQVVILCENSVFRNHGIYYGFEPEIEKQLQFIDWNIVDTSQLAVMASAKQVYMLINKDRMWYSKNNFSTAEFYRKSKENIPNFVLHPGLNWDIVKENSKTSLFKYKH